MTSEELQAWAASQPETELTDDELRKAWHWMMMVGPHSSWTNTEAKLVRVLILEVLRLRAGVAQTRKGTPEQVSPRTS